MVEATGSHSELLLFCTEMLKRAPDLGTDHVHCAEFPYTSSTRRLKSRYEAACLCAVPSIRNLTELLGTQRPVVGRSGQRPSIPHATRMRPIRKCSSAQPPAFVKELQQSSSTVAPRLAAGIRTANFCRPALSLRLPPSNSNEWFPAGHCKMVHCARCSLHCVECAGQSRDTVPIKLCRAFLGHGRVVFVPSTARAKVAVAPSDWKVKWFAVASCPLWTRLWVAANHGRSGCDHSR